MMINLLLLYLSCNMLLSQLFSTFVIDDSIVSFSTVCLAIQHCLAMSSSSNPPLSCWTVGWTPPPSSTSCPFLWCTGEFLTPGPVLTFFQSIIEFVVEFSLF